MYVCTRAGRARNDTSAQFYIHCAQSQCLRTQLRPYTQSWYEQRSFSRCYESHSLECQSPRPIHDLVLYSFLNLPRRSAPSLPYSSPNCKSQLMSPLAPLHSGHLPGYCCCSSLSCSCNTSCWRSGAVFQQLASTQLRPIGSCSHFEGKQIKWKSFLVS